MPYQGGPTMEQSRKACGSTEESFLTDYKMMMTLGQGNFSQVKMAFHVPTLTCVAVKILRNKKKNSSLVANEVNIMKCLEHPNIIKLFHVVQSRSSTYLVMEHASEGDLLRHILELGSLEEDEARRLFTQILCAVQYCHNNHIAHRDIKANNILLDCKGNAKLCDFGLAAVMPPGGRLKDFCGTLLYCAPELFRDEAYDGRASDVWSLGVLLFLMVAGRFPFRSSSSEGLRRQILAANFSVPQHISIDIFNVIVELLMINPSRRPTIDQIMRRPMIRDSKTHSSSASTQSLPGTPSPSIVSAMTDMGYKSEEIIDSLRHQKYNQVMATYLILQHQSPGGDCCHHQVKPIHVPLRRATENAPLTCTLPSVPQEKEGEKSARQVGTRHSMPANLCYQAGNTHLPDLLYLDRHRALFLMCSSEEMSETMSETSSEAKIGSSVSLMASVQPLLMYNASCKTYNLETKHDTYTISSCSSQGQLWNSLETAPSMTSRGSSLGDPMQVDPNTQEEHITEKVNIGQGGAMNEEELTTQETTITQDETITEEVTLTQEEVSTEEANIAQEVASPEETTITQEEAITEEGTLTQEEVSPEKATITQEVASPEEATITQEEASTERVSLTQEVASPEDATITQEVASPEDETITQEVASPEKMTTTKEEASTEEGTITQEEASTEDGTITQEVASTEEGTITQVEASTEEGTITQEVASTDRVNLTQEEGFTEERTTTQEEASTEDGTITQEEGSTDSVNLTQEEGFTEEGTTTQEGASTEEETFTQDETITKGRTLADGVTMNPTVVITEEEAIMEHEDINQEAAITLEVPITQQSTMTLDDIITQEEDITSVQPEDANPASSQNRRRPKWKRVKKTIVNCLRHLCCCLAPAKRRRDSSKNLAPKTQGPGVTPRNSPEEVEPQLHGL